MNLEPQPDNQIQDRGQSSWSRRNFMQRSALAASALALTPSAFAAEKTFPVVRTAVEKRKFKSAAIDAAIEKFKASVGNKELGWLFENCFPNTLDTTVEFKMVDGRPDTYVITGDIDAMWLRDSSAQVYPYLIPMRTLSTATTPRSASGAPT